MRSNVLVIGSYDTNDSKLSNIYILLCSLLLAARAAAHVVDKPCRRQFNCPSLAPTGTLVLEDGFRHLAVIPTQGCAGKRCLCSVHVDGPGAAFPRVGLGMDNS